MVICKTSHPTLAGVEGCKRARCGKGLFVTSTKIAIEGASVVAKGVFNASIFSPLWLRTEELIGDVEMKQSRIDVISRNVTSFSAGWLQCHVTDEGMQFGTVEVEEFPRLRDVAVGVLQLLRHTPIAALGINRDFHMTLDDDRKLHAFGDLLTPKPLWDQVMDFPGMRELTMWGARTDGYDGHVQVQVQPSQRVPHSVYVGYNDHFTLTKMDEPVTSRGAAWELDEAKYPPTPEKNEVILQVLAEEWAVCMDRAEKTANHLYKLAKDA